MAAEVQDGLAMMGRLRRPDFANPRLLEQNAVWGEGGLGRS